MTICNTYEEYKAAHDRYARYMEMVEEGQMPYVSRFDSVTEDGENPDKSLYDNLYEYDMTTKEQLLEMMDKQECTRDLKTIINEVLDNFGAEQKDGTLCGVEITEEDFYYIYKDPEGKIAAYNSCVGGI